MTKLLHIPTGLVGKELVGCDYGKRRIFAGESILDSNKENFKPLSEFNKNDLRDGDTISYYCASTGYVGGNYIRIPNQPSNTLDIKTDLENNFKHRGISDFDIMKVSRNGEVIWEHEEKSEVEEIIDTLIKLVAYSRNDQHEVMGLFKRLVAIELGRDKK